MQPKTNHNPNRDEPETIMTITEVSHYLRISRATVYALINSAPPLPSFKLRNRRLFSCKEVDLWLLEMGRTTNG